MSYGGLFFALNYTACMIGEDGRTGYERQSGIAPNFGLSITGQLVIFILAPTIVGHKTVGLFLDYHISPFGEFTGQYMCVCLEDLVGKSLHRDVDLQHFKLKRHRVEFAKLPPSISIPIVPLKRKFFESNCMVEGLERAEMAAQSRLPDYEQFSAAFTIEEHNGTFMGETGQVRFNGELYTYEDTHTHTHTHPHTHKVLSDGRVVEIDLVTQMWDRCLKGFCKELWQRYRSMNEAWRRLAGSVGTARTTVECGGRQH